MIIKSKQSRIRNRSFIDIYAQSTKGIVLEYFTIINKILNHYTDNNSSRINNDEQNKTFNRKLISVRQINSSFIREPYKEKSFFEKVSFFLSTTKDVLRTSKIDNAIESFNTHKELLQKLNELKKKAAEIDNNEEDLTVKEHQNFENMLNEFFKKYPEYKEAKDEFDRLVDEKIKKMERMHNLSTNLNKFRQYILDKYNPIVLELLDLVESGDSTLKHEYVEISEKLHQKINYNFKSNSSKEIIKSEKLLTWDELKNCIGILERDTESLDSEIDKIVGNEYFKNYINNELKDFDIIKSKLNSLTKQNKPKIITKPKETKKPIVIKDIEFENLKKELKILESKLQKLAEQKTEYLNDIEEFNREYNLHLGELIKEILSLKKEILYKQTIKQQKEKKKYKEDIQTFEDTKETIEELKSTIDELETALESIDEDDENYEELSQAYNELKSELEKLEDELKHQEEDLEKVKEFIEDETVEQEYEEVNSHYEEFESEYKHIKESIENSITLNDEEKKELKSLYKKAARLCHPDIVPDELKEKAHELMQKLNEAYNKKDITKVKEILHSLQNGTSFEVSSETIEDKELLKQKIKEYKQNIENIKSEIEEIKEDETYQTISELEDWDEYFEEVKSELNSEKEKLEEEVNVNISWDIDNLNKNVFIEWAENHDIKIENTSVLTATNKQLEEVPSEIVLFKNFKNIYLNKNKLRELPEYIVGLTDLKRLNLSDNYKLLLTSKQKEWIAILQKKGCNITLDDDLLDRTEKNIEDKYNLYKNEKPWLNNILRWAFENYLDTIISQKETLQYSEVLKLNGYSIEFIPKDIAKLKNLKELKLWNNHLEEIPEEISTMNSLEKLTLSSNNLIKLPKNIIQLNLKKLQLLDNKSLILTNEQIQWIKELQENGCDVEFDKDLLDNKEQEPIEDNKTKIKKPFKKTGLTIVKKKNKTSKTISKENTSYSKHIQAIENIKFEKIRRYCENLVKENESDEMQKHLGEKGKMYKALMYSALEVSLENLNGETITLCDWGCGQGIASMLVLDYIKEKQLDIKVSDVILIDDNTKALSRAMAQVEALAQNSIKFKPLKSDDNGICDTIKSNKNNIVINLFANDKVPTSFWTIDYEVFEDSYFLCVSNENKELVDEIYENINSSLDVQDFSILDSKIGKFEKHERIFEVRDNIPLIDIDENDIPF